MMTYFFVQIYKHLLLYFLFKYCHKQNKELKRDRKQAIVEYKIKYHTFQQEEHLIASIFFFIFPYVLCKIYSIIFYFLFSNNIHYKNTDIEITIIVLLLYNG